MNPSMSSICLHSKLKIISSFIHPLVIAHLHKKVRYKFEMNICNIQVFRSDTFIIIA